MAEKSDSRDSESSWVLAGGEALPVTTVGPEQDSTSLGAEDEDLEQEEEEDGSQDTAVTTKDAAAIPEGSGLGEQEEHRDPQDGAVPAPDGPSEPGVPDVQEKEESEAELGPSTGTPKAGQTLTGPGGSRAGSARVQTLPGSPSPGPPTEEGSCTSSDDDTEGLQRRQGQKPRPRPLHPGTVPHQGTLDTGVEDGLNVSKFLLGALALVAVGLLIVTGGIYDPVDGPVENVVSRDVAAGEQEWPLPPDSNDSQQKPPVFDTGDPQNLQSLNLLLDKLAKENQEIRLMQAELQAHRDELQALLQRSQGEVAAAGAQRQSLAAENARLHAALERESTALRDARDEIQRLRGPGAPGNPGSREPVTEKPPGTPAHREGSRWHLDSVRQELMGALERARRTGGLEGLMEELSALEKRLSQELEEAESFPGHWKKPYKAEKKESKRYKRHGSEEERKEQSKAHGKDPRPPREQKAGKTWGKSYHGPPRELPPLSRYRVPQGCSGVVDCAHKEGREVLGTALEPVQKGPFLRLLEEFMGRLGWGGHFGGLAAQLGGFFGPDGAFTHDRLRFVDFVEDVEDLLEDVARRERGDKEAADDFEEFVLRHYGGDRGTGKERGSRPPRQHRRGG
ncbi:pre-B-cell leukemia transcription factor-interacting protein 1 isoform X2 [Calypte anna]|uniref:pre-B-cell leukemia transcription factor-interacting protein 1 isoform X2 n=1 Tax=Calypte anna TaxID=9244 RepID=UPI0011C3492B|nr:pre-B-cell leukemia transcription factor-interacting protein 1 isoform X2 [Calypte anna]